VSIIDALIRILTHSEAHLHRRAAAVRTRRTDKLVKESQALMADVRRMESEVRGD
jgi:hypothetical protein